MKGGQVQNWASFRVAKTGQLRIPVFPCRLGYFGKIDLETDLERKWHPTPVLFRALSWVSPLDRRFQESLGSLDRDDAVWPIARPLQHVCDLRNCGYEFCG